MTLNLPDRTTVLIVGAGPAGLAAALSLLHHGFHDFIIVDAIPQGNNSSRAVVVHAATLEVSCLCCSFFFESESCLYYTGIGYDRLWGRHRIARHQIYCVQRRNSLYKAC